MSRQPDNLAAGTQVVSRVEIRGTHNSLGHPPGAVGLVTRWKHAAHLLCRVPVRKDLTGAATLREARVPVLHRGPTTAQELRAFIRPSGFDSAFDNPVTGRTDHLMDRLCVRLPRLRDHIRGRAKKARPESVEKLNHSEHWQHHATVPNQLTDEVEM